MLGLWKKTLEEKLFPDAAYPDVYSIDFMGLKEAGIKGLIFDIDNTLKPPGRSGPDERVINLFGEARKMGFELCLLSNSLRRRALRFSSGLGIYAVTGAHKPSARGFLKCVRLMDCETAQACVVGDQIFTDILGARMLGMRAVYINPITAKEEITVALKRVPEHYMLKRYNRAKIQ